MIYHFSRRALKDMGSSTDIKGETQNGQNRADRVSFGFRRVTTAEKRKLVDGEFDSIATRYDLANTLLSFGLHLLWKRLTVRMLELKPGALVLDVCGGTADLALLAAKDVGPEGRIVVYDINRAMMEVGRRKTRKSPFGDRILYVHGDAEMMSIRDRCLDAVMVGFGVRNLTHLEDGLREAWRVLKPGGRFACLEFSQPTMSWMRSLYDLYSFRIMPVAGRLITGNRGAYAYLAESIRVFPSPDRLAALLKEKGFSRVTYKRLTHGIAIIHLAEKR